MNHTEKIRSILAEADRQLLELIAESATAGDLSGVDVARSVAGRLRSVVDTLENSARVPRRASKEKVLGTASRQRKRAANQTTVPRFEVRKATLLRIGWSRKKNEQYAHKVPRQTVNEVVNAMVQLQRSGSGPYTVEQIARRAEQASNISIPTYQVYVVVGWLRAHDQIEQVGRDGYQIPEGLDGNVEVLWQSLDTPKR